ncbi:MAG: hypothetical protein M4579_006343 [Chaenotheca gracillima]|nr:MAG: hypothetical protein M4579_006343 [Chaenotheca gracillima]
MSDTCLSLSLQWARLSILWLAVVFLVLSVYGETKRDMLVTSRLDTAVMVVSATSGLATVAHSVRILCGFHARSPLGEALCYMCLSLTWIVVMGLVIGSKATSQTQEIVRALSIALAVAAHTLSGVMASLLFIKRDKEMQMQKSEGPTGRSCDEGVPF